jgi:glycosyltransferase involved in cell wall biosynthesis
VLLEAAAAELPTVACRSGGTAEAIVDGETGFLCPERDVEALAGALARLVADPSLGARLGRAGRERVIRQFDLSARTEALELIYDEALAARGAG